MSANEHAQIKEFCNIKEQKTEYYLEEKDELADFYVDQTVIIRKKYLEFVTHTQDDVKFDYLHPDEWYPFANSYYNFTEDVDPLERVNHLLAAKPSFVSSQSSIFEETLVQDEFPYSEKSAQSQYLESNPVSFIILGKPEIGERELGRVLADYWHCVYIEPGTLIEEEIRSGSRAGQCIEYNLRCGRAIGVDVLLRLVEKRVKSESAKHRGFVICGLPLIPNDLYEEDPVSSESAIFTVREIFEEVFETTIKIGVPPSKPQVSFSSKYRSEVEMEGEGEGGAMAMGTEEFAGEGKGEPGEDTSRGFPLPLGTEKVFEIPIDVGPDYGICYTGDIGTNYEDQLNFLFGLLKQPFLIIYVACGTADVINKRNGYRYSVYSGLDVNLHDEKYKNYLYESCLNKKNYETIPEDFVDIDVSCEDPNDLKHLVQTPRHFPANVSVQLDHYHYTCLNFIERYVLVHDPQYFVKVDGRTPVSVMFHIVKTKITSLPLQSVILPVNLNIVEESRLFGEGEAENYEKELSLEDAIRLFRTRDVVNNIFKWTLSDWGTMCPVMLAEGSRKNGVPDYAVHFMNKIFFLSDEAAFLKFYRNPRPFLKPPHPKSPCKLFIYGPQCSGKTAVGTCLAYILHGTMLSPTKLLESMLLQQKKEQKEMVRQTAITEAMAILNEERAKEAAEAEAQRIQTIKNWIQHIVDLIVQLIELLHEVARGQLLTSLEISAFPMAMKKISHAEIENETSLAIRDIRTELEDLNIPYELNIEHLEEMIKDRKFFYSFIPVEWKKKIEPKPATPFDDFVLTYTQKALDNTHFDLHINTQNLTEIYISTIKAAEERNLEEGHHKGGWIIDEMVCDVEVLEKLYPDCFAEEVILLQDLSPDGSFLKEAYQNRHYHDFRNYPQFFMDLGRVDEAWRIPSVMSTDSYKDQVARDIVSQIVDSDVIYKDASLPSRMLNYERDLDDFNTRWDQAAEFINSKGVDIIKIDVANKTVEEVMREAINGIEDRYRRKATLYTEEDRAEEVANLALFGAVGTQEEEGMGEGPLLPSIDPAVLLEQNRRYGDTFSFCPVSLHENWVFWKGKEDYAVKFEDKVYLLRDEEAMNKFLLCPRTYVTGKMWESLPPPRICVTGVPGSGKSALATEMADNYGIYYFNFEDVLKRDFHLYSIRKTLSELRMDEEKVGSYIYNYLNEGVSLPEEIIVEHMNELWFKSPIRELGFIIDGYPLRPADVALMIKNKFIPSVIIQLVPNDLEVKDFLVESYLTKKQEEIDQRRAVFEEENRTAIEERIEKRQARFQQMLDEKRENRYTEKRKGRKKSKTTEEVDTDRSQVSFNSVEDLKDIDEINKILDSEFPDMFTEQEPIENIDDLREKIEIDLQDTLKAENEFFDAMKIEFDKENVPYFKIPVELDYPNKSFRHASFATANYKFFTKSLLERCYEVSLEIAEKLLACGYFFLSKFGRTCPVQVYENKNPFQMYLISTESKTQIFPVIHRSYIYFLAGRENLQKFRESVLKYVDVRNIDFPLIPFKVGIMGPPKCGKTILAKKIQHDYGLNLITRGQAARYVLEYLPLSDLAINMEDVLRQGWELTDEMIIKCVEAACYNSRTLTQGAVFDGFPNTILEVKHLSYLGLVPNLVIDLEGTAEELLACFSRAGGGRGFPRYSKHFYEHLMSNWLENAENFRKWFDREYQVSSKISISTSNWSVSNQAKDLIKAAHFEMKHYYINIVKDWPLRLAYMQVTPLEFLERQSSYKTFCPCCLHFDNILNSGGDPPDRTGLVQFRNKYYWLCEDHIELFLASPETYLPPYNHHALPQELPVVLSLTSRPNNVAHGGNCVVCYKTRRALSDGVIDFAVEYIGQVFLFDSNECMIEFLKRPQLFMFEFLFRPPQVFPSLDYRELPLLGMLEQYVARPVVKALGVITRRRPVVPGLSASVSAAIGIGLYLKVFHAQISQDYRQCYVEADKIFHDRRLKLIEYLEQTKSVVNPFLYYEEPYPPFAYLESEVSESTDTTMTMVTKILDDVLDNIDYV